MKIEIESSVYGDRIVIQIYTKNLYIFEYDDGYTKNLQTYYSTYNEVQDTTDKGRGYFRNIEDAWKWINEVVKRVRYEVDLTNKLEEDVKKLPTEINID